MRRLFSPRWILVHLGVALLVFTMVNLGFWQLHRLDEKKAFNARVLENTTRPVVDISQMPEQPTVDYQWDVSEWGRVKLVGHYDTNHVVTIINRSQDGTAGYDIAVPFVNGDGTIHLVNRGFVPLAIPHPPTPEGNISIFGYVRLSQRRSAVGAVDSTDASNTEFQRFDIPLIAKATDVNMLNGGYIQLIQESPSANTQWPATVAIPALDEGPHLSYAMQWFFFSATALTAWVLVVRRKLREPLNDPIAPEQTSA